MPAVYSLLAVGANGQVAVRMNVGERAIDQSAEHVVAAACPAVPYLPRRRGAAEIYFLQPSSPRLRLLLEASLNPLGKFSPS
jgi:hypothetical protein